MTESADHDQPVDLNLDSVFNPKVDRRLRRLPQLIGRALRITYRAAKRELVMVVLLQVVASAATGIQLFAGRHLLSILTAHSSHHFAAMVTPLVEVTAALALGGMATVFSTEVQRLVSELVSRYSLVQVIGAACDADLVNFENPAYHDRLQRAVVNASIRPLQMTTGLLSVGAAALTSVAVAVALATVEPLLLVLGVVAVVPLAVTTVRLGRVLHEFAVIQTPNDRERSYLQILMLDRTSAKELRSYDSTGYLQGRYAASYERRISALRHVIRERAVWGLLAGLMTALLSGGSVAILIYLVNSHRISLAGAGTAVAAFLLLGSQLRGVLSGLGGLYESSLFIADYNSFVSGDTDIREFVSTAAVSPIPATITATQVGFTYPSRSEPSLFDISLSVEPGQIIALVGENGSGKTTLAKLLAGLYLPSEGSIRWGEQDLRDVDISAVRARIAVLFQDFVRYQLSAADNIGMGRWESIGDIDAVRGAARKAGIDDLISSLPNGYASYLGPQFFGGSDLSGGQWQRLALARAHFRDAELIILDEPTASLDPRAETALFESVRDLFRGRSVLLITHRMASVKSVDQIYVLSEGRIVERGNHKQLMAQKGLYQELFSLQAKSYR